MIYEDKRNKLIDIFEDTMKLCKTNEVLSRSVENSVNKTVVYSKAVDVSRYTKDNKTEISVTSERSLECAKRISCENPDYRICVHNFASATNAGGGVTRGSSAQEEAICRCSTLYPCLKKGSLQRDFYLMHKLRHDLRYTDTCIYTPDVKVIKSDTDFPQGLNDNEWFDVDVITCAAPNLREKPYNSMNPGSAKTLKISDNELLDIHINRARCILSVAAEKKADAVILGAFGCGAFRNKPRIVAKAYKNVLDEFNGIFKQVCFAVYCTPNDRTNFDMFKEILG